MRKWFIGLTALLLIVLFSFGIEAKPGKFKGDYEKYDYRPRNNHRDTWNQERNDARYIINRTANVIYTAQRAAQRGHRYVGLGPAVAHQQMAWDLYGKSLYRDAIFHSLRARNMALQIITGNREQIGHEYYRDDMEDRYAQSAPRDNELDVAIHSVKIGQDKEAVRFSLHLNITE